MDLAPLFPEVVSETNRKLSDWLAVAALTRISSAGALGASLSAPVWLYVLGIVSPIWATLPMIVLLWLRHAANIGRLIRGEEPKIGKR